MSFRRSNARRRWRQASRPSSAVCTIVARNYLAHARILATSYLRHHPGDRFYLLVVDGLPEGVEAGDGIHLVDASELELPYFFEMCFKYDVTELSTAVKPSLLRVLLDRYGEERVSYIDPDIMVFRPMHELDAALDSADIVLIPHLADPIPFDGETPSEMDILIAGAYNLGFIGLRRSATTEEMLSWWEERLRDLCRKDPASGLMVDQRWIDLVPGLFPSAAFLRDQTYNVAYWNLHGRKIAKDGVNFTVNGRPLTFFHFSGYDPAKPRTLSKYQSRHRLIEGDPLTELFDLYRTMHLDNGHAQVQEWTYGFSTFDNGIRVDPILRQIYLELDEETRRRFGDPFRATETDSFLDWATAPGSEGRRLSPFLNRMYRLRYDVAAAFPDVGDVDRTAFLEWASTQGAKEMGYDPALVRVEEHVVHPAEASATSRRDDAVSGDGGSMSTGEASTEVSGVGPALGVNVCGYLRDQAGLGSAARGYIRALRAVNIDLALKDVSHLSVNHSDDASTGEFDDAHPHPVNLVCINADQHFVVAADHPQFFEGRYNIGIWAWELPTFPAEWADRFNHYDEIWVGSSFIVNALGRLSPIPVVRIPPALTSPTPGSRERGRARLGLNDADYLFVFIFDFHSFFERKNPLAVIEAFKKGFRSDERARLVIKCMNGHIDAESFARLTDAASDPRVELISHNLSATEVADLQEAADTYVSLHRSEGTGLTITESMALGKPVIATGWSGNVDYMDVSNSFPVRYDLREIERDIGPYKAGQVWAEPSIDHAAEMMRFVFAHPDEARDRGEVARRTISSRFSPEAVGSLIRERLQAIDPSRTRSAPLPPSLPLPGRGNDHILQPIRDIAASVVPEGATVLVISRGDEQLVDLDGRVGWHFPRTEEGTYAGYYPANSKDAIAHLERLRGQGATYLFVPETSNWWLSYYEEFRNHLDTHYERVVRSPACIVYRIERVEQPNDGEVETSEQGGKRSEEPTQLGTEDAEGLAKRAMEERIAVLEEALERDTERLARLTSTLETSREREDDRVARLQTALEGVIERDDERAARFENAIEDLIEREDDHAAELEAVVGRMTALIDERLSFVSERISSTRAAAEEASRRTAIELASKVRDEMKAELEGVKSEIARVEGALRDGMSEGERASRRVADRFDVAVEELSGEGRLLTSRVEQLARGIASNTQATLDEISSLQERIRRVHERMDQEDERIETVASRTEGLRGELRSQAADLEEASRNEARAMRNRIEEIAKQLQRIENTVGQNQPSADGDLGLAEIQDAVRTLRERMNARLGRLSERADANQDLAKEAVASVKRLEGRFKARPYVSSNAFGTLGDLEHPMGYAERSGDGATFADIFRGPREFIRERQRVYLQFFTGRTDVLDLGCGRGEFLELLRDADVEAIGVDEDERCADECLARGLKVVRKDAVEYLADLPEASLGGIFSAQMIEHLDQDRLTEFLRLAATRLRPGGVMVAETVNPEAFEALKTFHVDPTHQKPIFPQVLLFLCEQAGFRNAQVFYPLGGGFTQSNFDRAGEYAVVART